MSSFHACKKQYDTEDQIMSVEPEMCHWWREALT